LDAGCGSSHLTFGTFHYLHNVLGLPVRLTGVDTNRALMQRSNKACEDLGIQDVAAFHTAGGVYGVGTLVVSSARLDPV
jgi:hypothetical protein